MLVRERLAKEGNFLFRWRSYVPLVLVPLIALALPEALRVSHQIGSEAEHAVFYLSVLVSFAGLAVRWATIAFVPPGTSGRNTLSQRAEQLNTTGMYSIVRNPLYLGNFVAILGVVLCIKVWWLVAIFALCYWLYIERIIAAEEVFLESRFKDTYRQWAMRVPAFLPKPANWVPPAGRFSLPFLLRREYNGVLAVGGSYFALELVMDVFVEDEPLLSWVVEDWAWVALGATTLALFLILRFLKTQTRLLKT